MRVKGEVLRPESVWPVAEGYSEMYDSMVSVGRETARNHNACIVAIGRNAMPMLVNTLNLVSEVQRVFRSCEMFVFENDSTDGTDAVLDQFADEHAWFTVEHGTIGGVDSRGFERERTERLAFCRNKCLEWVHARGKQTTWTIVLDLDPEHGFSVDGVFNSIGWLAHKGPQPCVLRAGGMASYSLYAVHNDGEERPSIAHYDAWAARPNWWEDRRGDIGFMWFSGLLFPVGSPPVAMNSAFGGLAVYLTEAFRSGGYSGEDCEHVPHHYRMHQAGWQMWLNPGCRYISIWR